jgi:CheY-like chemotaxis protein
MWVESEPGVGATFHFTILAQAVDQPVVARPHLHGHQPLLEDKQVLIVDDNVTNRRVLNLQVQKWGMQPGEAASPDEALEMIANGDLFDVAILDMHMPGMDGLTLGREIRKHPGGKSLPLVLFTSLGRREVNIEEGDFAAHLTKPIKPSLLFDALMGIFAKQTVESQGAHPEPAQFDAEMSLRHPLRILLAEDNAVNQKLALRLLEKIGYRADVAGNGLEAIEALQRQSYDVILMDVQMPEMDGLEATRQIIHRWADSDRPRIVAMTANAMQGDREMCILAGMDDYIAKPIRVEELVNALREAKAAN